MIYTIDYYTHRQCEPDWKLNDASIPYYNMTFVLGGEAHFIIDDDEEISCFAGDCLFLYPGTKRVGWTNPDNPLVCAAFNIVDIPYAINLPRVVSFRENSHVNFYIREFDAAYSLEPRNKLQLSAIITLLICELDTSNKSTNKKNPHIDMAEKYIKANICLPLSADDVAQAIHLAPTYFGALFKRCTGESVMSYINRYKMITAASFLSDPKMTVTKAAERTGFSDIYYFSKVFKKTYGISPMAYKKGEFPKNQKKNVMSYTLVHADSAAAFSTIDFPPQTGHAEFTFNFVANSLTDGIVALSSSKETPWNWTDLNIVIQIQPDGLFWAIDKQTFNAADYIAYTPNVQYTIDISTDIDKCVYDAYVTGNDGIRRQLAKSFSYRSSAKTPVDLGKLCVRSGHNMPAGVLYVEKFRVLRRKAAPGRKNDEIY